MRLSPITRRVLPVLLVVTAAWAGGPTYAESLRAGRKAEAEGNYADAVTAFERCVELAPRDVTALGELGWAAFEARDLPKAKRATQQALAIRPTAALLYNLGRIEEAEGSSPVASYVASLGLRQDETVRAHLRLLEPTRADAMEPFATRAMQGPYASMAAYCAAAPRTPLDDTGHDIACTCGDPVHGRAAIYDGRMSYDGDAIAGAPFDTIVVRPRACEAVTDRAAIGRLLEIVVGVRVAGKWYATAIDSVDRNVHGGVLARINGIAVVDGQARIDYTIGGNYQHRQDDSTWSAHAVVVIGIGATKLPSVTHPIVFEQEGVRRGAASLDSVVFKRTLAFGKDGAVQLAGAPDALDQLDAKLGAALRGTHALAFP